MRENGYPEESKHDRVLSALRSYRIRNAQQREKRGRVDVLQEKKGPFERQIQMEERDLAEHDGALVRRLAAGFESSARIASTLLWKWRLNPSTASWCTCTVCSAPAFRYTSAARIFSSGRP